MKEVSFMLQAVEELVCFFLKKKKKERTGR
jgi:hypothetical protein